jgi:ABC-type branched-subunit amino acid transport system substrate-binding protein
MGNRGRLAGAVVTAAVALAACGTRLPNTAFVKAAQVAPGDNSTAPVAGQPTSAGATGGPNETTAVGSSSSTASPVAATATGGGGSSAGNPTAAASGGGGTGNGGTSSAGPNTASDIGVTADSITIGNITGVSGPLGPDAFGPTLSGLRAWVGSVNARGGINGRKIVLAFCDDGQDGAQNLACTQQLVTHNKVFAFVDNNSLATSSSAHYEYQQGVPDLGLPLNNGYYKYPNMFTLYGNGDPRNGTQVGTNGLNYAPTASYRFYKQVLGITHGAFFFYSQAASQSAARSEEAGAQAEGIQITYESGGHQGEQIGVANFDADVLAMKNKNVDGVWDAVDVAANQKICASMDRYGVKVKAKISTIEAWSQDIGGGGWSAPCRNSIFVDGQSVPFQDTQVPAVAQFRHDFDTYSHGALLHQWALDGYSAGMIFGDAIQAMGANVTRKGFISWMDGIVRGTYNDHGLLSAAQTSWQPQKHPGTYNDCYAHAQWQDTVGTFVTRSGPNEFSCYTTAEVVTPYTDDGS